MKLFRVFAGVVFVGGLTAFGGCATTPKTAGQTVYVGASDYLVALHAATIYKGYPPCDAARTVLLCSDPAVVAKIQQADDRAYPAVMAAEKTVQDVNAAPGDVAKAEAAASDALAYLLSIIPPPAVKAAKTSVTK